ncbi:hypothetical protein MesoLjLc_05900 [Mesorhizobium sp. L-8-10]|uniref:hypothetical protein n=1 Tax=unclassified Mesorhizobium TaxID=325217 RepID=UPI0019280277|nr:MULTISPECIES: hypothetical protein [unclassified Mesorhizobium]BCH20832.1 hypothetical protein MesoLjLb_06170 [Mesorhizobium sp. L-8-3]BCH28660.1 hypothetical protein MesoLjLc_05900 [Mesorhizobium sp. L-8-10]
MQENTEIRLQAEGAIAKLHSLLDADAQDTDEQELIGLAALAAGAVADPERRHALTEGLIAALTALHFGPVFDGEQVESRKQAAAILDELAVTIS